MSRPLCSRGWEKRKKGERGEEGKEGKKGECVSASLLTTLSSLILNKKAAGREGKTTRII